MRSRRPPRRARRDVLVNLTNATNATIADAQGVGTITDDDPRPGLDQRRDRDRGRRGHGHRDLHRHARRRPAAATVTRRLRDGQRHRVGPADYTADQWRRSRSPPARRRRRSPCRQRRRARRDQRDVHARPARRGNATIADAAGSARSPTTTRCPRSRSTT